MRRWRMKTRKGCRKPVQDFFLNLRFSILKLASGSSLSGSRGAWGGSQRWGAIFEAHIFAPRRKTSLACPVQGHQNTPSWVQPSRNWPTSPTILLSQGGRSRHHRSSCSANPRLSVLAKEGRPQKCCTLLYHPLFTPLSHLLTPSFILSSSSFFCFICLVIWSRL